jgi:hypothetical protein
MVFRFQEKPSSGNATLDQPTRELVYYASGSTDRSFVEAYAYSATAAILSTPRGTLYRQDIKVSWSSSDYAVVTVPYGPNSRMPGSWKMHYDTAGGTIHITNSKSTVNRYPVGQAPDEKGAIGHNGEDIDGADVVTPALKINFDFRFPSGAMGLSKIKLLARRTAYVNNDTWMTFAPGEALFLGASGEEGSDCETTATLQFAMSENVDGLTIGDIAGISKNGHDYVWIRYQDLPDGGKATRVPKYVYVERVYYRTSFATLFGFGG